MMKLSKTYFTGAGVLIMLLIFLTPGFLIAQDQRSNCIDCHKDLDDEMLLPAQQFENDVHYDSGIMCVDCHGGDSRIDPDGDLEIAMDPAKGYIGAIERTDLPKFCDKCHGNAEYMRNFNPNMRVDQYQRYKTSRHGLLLAEGDEKVAVCTDCHAIHEMQKITDPKSKVYTLEVMNTCGRCHSDPEYMSSYGIPTDQGELYQKSVHYESMFEKGDLSSPTCNDCHGNHGAIPPGVESIDNVCGTCHFSNKELFDESPHFEAFRDMDQPECVTCHSNHEIMHTGDYMLDTETGICWDCHDADSAAGQTTLSLISELEGLIRKHEVADSLITLAETKGMEVQEYKVKLINNNSHITSARNLVHTLSLEKMREETDPGNKLADSIIEGGFEALEEISIRRTGLLISLLFILFVILALYFKIKSLPEPEEKI